MVNNGYTREMAMAALVAGPRRCWWPSARPSSPTRTLNLPDRKTFYGGGAEGYTDYPALDG
jgi:N-ethylmaleimide reductase